MNPKKGTKIMAVLVIFTGILLTYYLLEQKIFSIPIDNEDDAIAYAKTDTDMINFMNLGTRKDNTFYVKYFARFNETENKWMVFAARTDMTDTCFGINFNPNGTITGKIPNACPA